jgi:hypothetical protein
MTTGVVGWMLTPLEKLIEEIAPETLSIQMRRQIKRTFKSKDLTSLCADSDVGFLH